MDKENEFKNIKIAFLSNFTIDPIVEYIKKVCLNNKINPDIYVSTYNQYIQEILNKSGNLYKFNPEIIFISLDIENFLGDFFYYDGKDISNEVEKKFNEFIELLEKLKSNISSKIIINNLLLPIYSSKGILENKDKYGLLNSIKRFNEKLEDYAIKDSQLFIFDINLFCMRIGYNKFSDKRFSYLADMKISIPALEDLAEEYMAYLLPLKSIIKKCIVLDLDNTLWGGIVGEAGLGGIKLGPYKEGRPYLDFQKRLLELFNRGIILAINSKNNLNDAMEVIKNHKYMILKEDNFACMRINWNDKVSNLIEIAKELNIGIDSLVFFDDNPSEREIVRKLLPEVMVVEMPTDPAFYSKTLENLKIFNMFSTTKEDLERGKMYIAEKKREVLKASLKDIKSFIEELDINILINDNQSEEIPRLSQLTQKTNQFNLTTKRYSEEDVKDFINSKNYIIKSLHVKDKFGDYGLTGIAIIKKQDKKKWELDSFLLSCRILGKDIEFSFIKNIINQAKKENVDILNAKFVPTNKNLPAKDFLKQAGFKLIKENKGIEEYSIKIK